MCAFEPYGLLDAFDPYIDPSRQQLIQLRGWGVHLLEGIPGAFSGGLKRGLVIIYIDPPSLTR